MTVQVLSFSFRFGIPTEADLVFDVRFLKNPHYDPDLRPLTGQDKAVSDHVKSDPEFGGFSDRLLALVSPLLPRYEAEGKKHLTIAVGCTGGRHRSVTVAKWLHARLKEQHDAIVLSHRDIHRDKERYQA